MTLRRAAVEDAAAICRLHRHTMRVSLPFLPDLHDEADVIAFIGSEVLPNNEVWVAEGTGGIVGYVAFAPGWINQLYVHPDAQGRGHGSALLAKALGDGQPRQLWTFQKNARARRFYEARGFRAVRFTDGADNMETEPDVLYERRP